MSDRIQRRFPAWLAALALTVACVSGPGPNEIKQSEIQYDLGVDSLRTGQPRAALKEFLDVVRLNPAFAEGQNALGLTYHLLGDQEKAEAHLLRALELRPAYAEVCNNLARIYISQGKFREAIPLLNLALDDVFLPERYLAESNLGWALFNSGEEEQAFKRVRSAIAQNENFCVGYEYLGLMFKARKQYQDALREFGELTKRCPQYLSGFRHLGNVALMVGDLEQGCRALSVCFAPSRMSDIGQECERLFSQASCPKQTPASAPPPAAAPAN